MKLGKKAKYLQTIYRPDIKKWYEKDFINLSNNEASYGRYKHYPYIYPVYEALSTYLQTDIEKIFPTKGAEEGLQLVFNAFVEKDMSVVRPEPTFGMIDVYEKFNKAKSCKVDYDVNRKLNIDNFVKQINSNSFVYIANPDNPTGIELSLVQLQSIIQKAKKKDVFVLLDETYKAFSKNNFQFYNEPNVISVGSFSKSHGLAGIRLGYVVADPKVIDIIKKLRSIDEVNSVAAKECIKLNNKIKDKNVKNVKKWKRIFQKTFPKHYRETSTNFIILKFKEPKHIYLYKKLYENKILTRADFEHISMSGVLRITVSTNSQMKKVLQILKREI